jgi:hypothetical protein
MVFSNLAHPRAKTRAISGECQQFEALLKFRVSSQWAGSSIRRGKGRKS